MKIIIIQIVNLYFFSKEGQIFGEASFFTNKPQAYTAQSKEFLSLLAIKREDFLNIIRKKSEDYEQYCMIRDQMILDELSHISNKSRKCQSCESFDHETVLCNFFHYIPDREKIIKSYDFSVFQERDPSFKRNYQRTKNSLKSSKSLIKTTSRFQKELKKQTKLSYFLHLRSFIKNHEINSNFFDSGESFPTLENLSNDDYISEDSEDSLQNIQSDDQQNENNENISQRVFKSSSKSIVLESEVKKSQEILENQFSDHKKSKTFESFNKSPQKDNKEEKSLEENIKETSEKKQIKSENSGENMQLRINKPLFNHHETKRVSGSFIIMPDTFVSPSDKSQKKENFDYYSEKKNILCNETNQIYFEKCENFQNYFPMANPDKIVKIYNTKHKKSVFLKKFHPEIESFSLEEKEKINESQKKPDILLKNLGKYSFFPQFIKEKINFNKGKKSMELGKLKKNEAAKEAQSPFFKKFNNKSASFFSLAQELLKSQPINKKKT